MGKVGLKWELVGEQNGQSRQKPKDLFSSASALPPTPALPSLRLTAVNVRRG